MRPRTTHFWPTEQVNDSLFAINHQVRFAQTGSQKLKNDRTSEQLILATDLMDDRGR